MFTSRLWPLFLLTLFLPFGSSAVAQNAAAPTQLAVEIRFYPGLPPAHLTVDRSRKRGIWFGRFPRVPGYTPPTNSLPLTAVNVNALEAEEGVRIWLSVYLGKIHEEEKQINSYLLREGESITANELTSVGVVPFEFKVVRLAASIGEMPGFKSEAPSIELVSMQPNFSTLPTVRFAVRNVSSKPVHALEVATFQDGRRALVTMPQGVEGQALIAPSGTVELTTRLATWAVAGADNYQPQAMANQTIQITAAVFGDGSYEGDSEKAMSFLGFQKGRKAALLQIVELLDKSADGLSLKEKISALEIVADRQAIEDLHQQFPQEKRIDRLDGLIRLGMQGARDAVLKDLTEFQLHSRYQGPNAFNSWLASAKDRYRAWLSRL